MRSITFLSFVFLLAACSSVHTTAGADSQRQNGELDALISPYALLPDETVIYVLDAAEHPDALVKARYMNPVSQPAAPNWPKSVAELYEHSPKVLYIMGSQLGQTQKLSQAYRKDPDGVWSAIIQQRQRAAAAGKYSPPSIEPQIVVKEQVIVKEVHTETLPSSSTTSASGNTTTAAVAGLAAGIAIGAAIADDDDDEYHYYGYPPPPAYSAVYYGGAYYPAHTYNRYTKEVQGTHGSAKRTVTTAPGYASVEGSKNWNTAYGSGSASRNRTYDNGKYTANRNLDYSNSNYDVNANRSVSAEDGQVNVNRQGSVENKRTGETKSWDQSSGSRQAGTVSRSSSTASSSAWGSFSQKSFSSGTAHSNQWASAKSSRSISGSSFNRQVSRGGFSRGGR